MQPVKGSGCGNQPKSLGPEASAHVKMATVAITVNFQTILACIKISVYLTLKKTLAGVTQTDPLFRLHLECSKVPWLFPSVAEFPGWTGGKQKA